eukprot:m.33557 g.33557  ORF g.33557 m.33557 type:complete len:174 (+) comp14241_c0_seq6:650-1171(+)
MAECGIYHDSIWHILQFGGAIARSLTRAMTVRTQTGLAQYASISAFEDRRFNPITHDELAHLHCTVSLLVEFERGRDYLDWTVGVHGIRIELRDAATGNVVSATYLPEVASEQGWSKVQVYNVRVPMLFENVLGAPESVRRGARTLCYAMVLRDKQICLGSMAKTYSESFVRQ